MRKVLLADNQDITNLGLKYLLNSLQIKDIDDVSNKKELVNLLTRHPDSIVVLDYTLLDFGRVEELLNLQARFELAKWILFSEELSDDFLKVVVMAHQNFSVVLKTSEIDQIEAAINSSIKGERYVCNRVLNQLLLSNKSQKKAEDNLLTATEREILREMAEGKTTKQIAESRNLSFHTVVTHRKNIFRKLGVNNVHEATKYAMRAGIVDVMDYYI